ncbi:MAG: CPBP family intramembrane metalloprotease [Bacillaceae bacterium]|nr:CPBP family intramembrane metalloprotease [Bacillaceae bacterium]
MKQQTAAIIILSIFSALMMVVAEQILNLSYVSKTIVKIILFLGIPIVVMRFVWNENILKVLNLKNIHLNQLRTGILIGVISMLTIIGAFVLFQGIIDTSAIIDDLKDRLEITAQTFIFVAIYITFGNSLLEEFYFRGFIFFKIYQNGHKILAYLFSSLLFSLYHVAIFAVWFDFGLILLALAGLFVIGLVFNYLNTRSKNFLNSWIIHIMADTAIVSIGFYLFLQ